MLLLSHKHNYVIILYLSSVTAAVSTFSRLTVNTQVCFDFTLTISNNLISSMTAHKLYTDKQSTTAYVYDLPPECKAPLDVVQSD